MNFDPKELSVAKRYSKALLETGLKKHREEVFFADLNRVQETLESSEDLSNFLTMPQVKQSDKLSTLKEIFTTSISSDTLSFLNLLVENNRLKLLQTIIYSYEEELNKELNIIKANVKSAIELDFETKKRLKSVLENKFSKRVKFTFDIDEELIAGMVVSLGENIIDGSVKGKLETLQKQII